MAATGVRMMVPALVISIGGTDDGARVGDQHQIVVVIHRGDACKQTRLVRKTVAGHAKAAASLDAEILKLGALAVAVFGHGNQLLVILYLHSAYHIVALTQAHAAYTASSTGKGTDGGFGKALSY